MENLQTTPNPMAQSTIPQPNKQHEDQQEADDLIENAIEVVGLGRRRRCLPAELLCEMAKWLPWKVQKEHENGKNNAKMLLVNHGLSTFLVDRFLQFRAKHMLKVCYLKMGYQLKNELINKKNHL